MFLQNKFKGCLVGLACGDYLGMPVEFSSGRDDVVDFFNGEDLKPVDFIDDGVIRRKAGYYTDDTAMALCLAESLYEKGFDTKDQFMLYRKWLLEGHNTPFGDRAFGVGQHTFKILTRGDENNLPTEINHVEAQGGNGALMRCAPVGMYYYDNMAELREKSILSAIVTHNNTDAAWSCVVLNSYIAYALRGYPKEDFGKLFLIHHKNVPEDVKKIVLTNFRDIMEISGVDIDGFTLHTLRVALHAFFITDKYSKAVAMAVFAGGDTDTQAAVAGALAGAYYGFDGIPENWRETLINKEFIGDLAVKIYNKKVFAVN